MLAIEWEKIKEDIYFEDGSLRDIVVDKITKNQWIKLVDIISLNYNIEVFYNGELISNDLSHTLFQEIFISDEYYYANVDVSGINLHLYFFKDYLEMDILPKEVNTINKHQAIVDFMSIISVNIESSIKMTCENMPEICLMEVSHEKICYY